jgi:hypothetical protein
LNTIFKKKIKEKEKREKKIKKKDNKKIEVPNTNFKKSIEY